ncbi:uncharacterized protein [Periplaneta americana]|uniref:uncharacterized protein n=1 Tax=Periplaneta americana TaxID=6978 RepID=UPI0037E86D6E
MTTTTTKKEAILAFIETYRSLPELWNLEHPHYSNRRKKAAAYDSLIEKLKVIEPDASRETVVKKINNLRSAFRKELKKVNDSKKSGASGDDVYIPVLWYFNELLFLVDQEMPEPSVSTLDEGDEDDDPHRSVSAIHTNSLLPTYRKKRKIIPNPTSAQDFLRAATSYLEKEDDEFLIMAKGYAAKLKKLTKDQLIFADRVITEALVDAQMGVLTRWSYVANSAHSSNPPSTHE